MMLKRQLVNAYLKNAGEDLSRDDLEALLEGVTEQDIMDIDYGLLESEIEEGLSGLRSGVTVRRLVNCTQHEINILDRDENVITSIPADGPAARVTAIRREKLFVNGVPVVLSEFGNPENLPDPVPGTYYIVSRLMAQALPERKDLLHPKGTVIKGGQIVGCRGLGGLL